MKTITFLAATTPPENDGSAIGFLILLGIIAWICYLAGKGGKPKGYNFGGTIQPRQ